MSKVDEMDIPPKDRERLALRYGDVLVCEGGDIGRTAMWRKDLSECYYQNHLHRLRRKDHQTCPEFFVLWMETAFQFLKLYGGAGNRTTIPNLSSSRLKEFKFPLPPLPEQKKIASVLAKTQRAVELQEAILANVRELKKSLMHRLLTNGLRGEKLKQTKMGKVPVSWEVIPFSQGVAVKQGQVDPTQSPFNEMLHIGSENIESGTGRLINFRTNKELGISSGNYHFTPDDVLYSKIRPYLKKAALPTFEGTCSADMYPLKAIDNQFHRGFLFHLLLGDRFSKEAISFQERTGIPKINRAQLGAILLPKPPLSEQVEIAHILQTLDEKLTVHESKKAAMQDLFKTTLNQLMTGAVRVANLDIDTSEVEAT